MTRTVFPGVAEWYTAPKPLWVTMRQDKSGELHPTQVTADAEKAKRWLSYGLIVFEYAAPVRLRVWSRD